MIKINLIAEKKQTRTKAAAGAAVSPDGPSASQNLVLVALFLLGVAVAGGWWWKLSHEIERLQADNVAADAELERLEEVRKKGDQYKKQKELLARKIELITNLKKQQDVPVHILDQISKKLPEFLWLEGMSVNNNQVSLNGKATTYNAVTNFYNNVDRSGLFGSVLLGRVFEVQEGVQFSMTCTFTGLDKRPDPDAPAEAAEDAAAAEGAEG